MLKFRWGLAVALASIAALTIGTSLGGAARARAQANVTVRIAASSQTTAAGSNLTYTLTVRNFGPQRAPGVVVRDRLPARVAFVSAESTKGTCSGTAVVSCLLGTLRPGAVQQVKIVVQTTAAGRIVNTATVRSMLRDQAMWNNQASHTTIVGAAANLGLSLAATPRPATVGQPLTYTLTARNLSGVEARTSSSRTASRSAPRSSRRLRRRARAAALPPSRARSARSPQARRRRSRSSCSRPLPAISRTALP